MTFQSVSEALTTASQFVRSGKIAEADGLCRQILAAFPDHPDAHHIAAMVALRSGNWTAAEHHIRIALSQRPGTTDLHNHLCTCLEAQGRKDEALDAGDAAFDQLFRRTIDTAFGTSATDGLRAIIVRNRALLAQVACWIEDKIYTQSIFNYGLPPFARPLIDLDVGCFPTYADLMVHLARRLTTSVRYLELGVSVGKTFYLMLNNLRNARLVAFDIEDINPTLSGHLEFVSREAYGRKSDSMRQSEFTHSFHRHTPTGNIAEYVAGDIFDRGSWGRLEGKRFNLIFSDAFHSADALRLEMEMLIGLDLIDDREFVMIWDDLESPDMFNAFREIVRTLTVTYNLSANAAFALQCGGWLGHNEHLHTVGVVIKSRRRA